MTPGLDALLSGAAILDLSSRGRIRVAGEDRARLLHAMTTNHIQQMKPGDGLYAFFLNAQGRIQADAWILCFDDHLLLDTEPETRKPLVEHLDRYIIADDVTLEDESDATFCIGLEGPRAPETSDLIALPAPVVKYSHARWGEFSVAAISMTSFPAVRIYGPLPRKEELIQQLESAGAIAASERDADAARLHNFRPRYGREITDSTLPQESQQMQALHFQKGCYLGQEIIERIRSRGHVNKQLMGFRLDAAVLPEPGAKLFAGGKEAGEVSSAALFPEDEFKVVGLAYVRVPYNKPGAIAGIDGRPAELFAPAAA